MKWKAEPAVELKVLVAPVGPFDNPFVGHTDITRFVRGQGIEIRRGRSDEFQGFQAGTCTFTIRNDGREFDPSLTGTWLELPGAAGATASTPDSSSFQVVDLDVRARVTANDWTPGGFGQVVVSQWGSAGNESWLFGLTAAGNLVLNFTTDGTTDQQRTSTVVPGFVDGTDHWMRATLDVNNGAAGHDVRFYTSTDGAIWTQLGATVTTAGTVTLFDSTANLVVGDTAAGGLFLAGKIRKVEIRNGIDGAAIANPDFTAQHEPHDTTIFHDARGNEWTINGSAIIDFDDDASPFAALLKPMRRLWVFAEHLGVLHTLFVGFIDGWPRTWTKTTGSVEITARDVLGVMARAVIAPSHGVLTLDDTNHGRLDSGRLAGDLPEQTTGERVTTLLQLAGFTAGTVLVADTGLTRVVGIEPTGNILQLIQDSELAEAGFFFVDKGGVIRFYDRHARFQKPRTATVQATFTDLQYSGLEIKQNLNQVWNDIMFSRPSAGEHDEPNHQHFTDSQSLHDFGILSYSKEIPVISDGETLGRAEFWVERYGRPKDRLSPIVVSARHHVPTMLPALADRELLDRIEIVRSPLNVGPTTTFTGLVEQIEHRITNQSWETTLAISPIDVDEGAAFMTLDNLTVGQLDFGVFAY